MTAETKTEQAPTPEQAAVYVVQRLEEVEVVVSRPIVAPDPNSQTSHPLQEKVVTEKRSYWVDIATVPLPPKSMRKSAIRPALAEAGIKPEARMGSLRVRVLDEESARVREVPVVVAEPTFDI